MESGGSYTNIKNRLEVKKLLKEILCIEKECQFIRGKTIINIYALHNRVSKIHEIKTNRIKGMNRNI